MNARQFPFVLAAGALFGAGLAWSTMISPEVVLDFLQFQDLGLLLVLGGAVAVTLCAYHLVPHLRSAPLAGGRFQSHPAVLDRRTIVGAALFGIGWGLCGVCPGPAVAGLGAGNWAMAWSLLGLVAGAYVQGRWWPGAVSPPAVTR